MRLLLFRWSRSGLLLLRWSCLLLGLLLGCLQLALCPLLLSSSLFMVTALSRSRWCLLLRLLDLGYLPIFSSELLLDLGRYSSDLAFGTCFLLVFLLGNLL
jgi:hypothetical protein